MEAQSCSMRQMHLSLPIVRSSNYDTRISHVCVYTVDRDRVNSFPISRVKGILYFMKFQLMLHQLGDSFVVAVIVKKLRGAKIVRSTIEKLTLSFRVKGLNSIFSENNVNLIRRISSLWNHVAHWSNFYCLCDESVDRLVSAQKLSARQLIFS